MIKGSPERTRKGCGNRASTCRKVLYTFFILHSSFFILQAQFTPPADTVATDSLRTDTIPDIERLTMQLDWALDAWSQYAADSIRIAPERIHWWDETDTLPGWRATLGQVGKPYVQYRNGFADRYWESPLTRDPLTGHTNVYLLNPQTQLPGYDTRTPFVDVTFAQARRDQQLLNVTVSQNASPGWNWTALYRRRTAEGAYLNNPTDHVNLALGTSWRHAKGRSSGRGAVAYSVLNDALNGGVEWDFATSTYGNSFQKELAMLGFGIRQAKRETQLRTAWAEHRQLWVNDSSFQVGALAGARFDSYTRYFTLPGTTDAADVNVSGPFRNWYADSLVAWAEQPNLRTLQGWGGVLLNLRLPGLEWLNRATLNASFLRTNGTPNLNFTRQDKQTLEINSRLRTNLTIARLEADFVYRLSRNDLLDAETALDANGALAFGYREFLLQDSTVLDSTPRLAADRILKPFDYAGAYAPVRVGVHLRIASQNAPLQDQFWSGNTFRGGGSFRNEQLYSVQAWARYTGAPGIWKGLAHLQDYAEVRLGVARLSNPVLYTVAEQVFQPASSQAYATPSATVSFRKRIWHLYIENSTTYQRLQRTNNAPTDYLHHLPEVYGRASVAYRWMAFRRKMVLYIAADAQYHTGHAPLQFDPSTQVFFPGTYRLDYGDAPGAVRLDATVSGVIRRVTVFFKVLNTLEGIGQPGYWTTLYYPMQERAFSFGVNWQFVH